MTKLTKLIVLFIIFSLTIVPVVFSEEGLPSYVPTLDEISGQWVEVQNVTTNPSLRNFRSQALVTRGMSAINFIAGVPYATSFTTGNLVVNGVVPRAQKLRWQPYQALRKTTHDKIDIFTANRMVFEEYGISSLRSPLPLASFFLNAVRTSKRSSVVVGTSRRNLSNHV